MNELMNGQTNKWNKLCKDFTAWILENIHTNWIYSSMNIEWINKCMSELFLDS